jgi:hypothetical protein
MRVPGGFFVANSACGDIETWALEMDGVLTAIRIFSYEEADGSFVLA